MRIIFTFAALLATAAMAFAVTCVATPTPGPLLGLIGGPWGLAAGAAGYGVYRLYKANR